MTTTPFFQVDAFAERPLGGNPAAVMPLTHWLDDELMQAIAAENNLSETAFTVPSERDDADYDLRWFTPTVEVDLCGHATLAAAHILLTGKNGPFFDPLGHPHRHSRRRIAPARFARRPARASVDEPDLCAALGLAPRPIWVAAGFNDSAIVPVESEAEVRAVRPDFAALKDIRRMAIVTAPGDEHAVASRVFVVLLRHRRGPGDRIAPTPRWCPSGPSASAAINSARSRRASAAACSNAALAGDRVILGGRCFTVIEGCFQL